MKIRFIQILTVPKNAIVKQYQKMLELDDVAFDSKMMHCWKLQKKQLNGKQEHVVYVQLLKISCLM